MSDQSADVPIVVDRGRFCDELNTFFTSKRWDDGVVSVDSSRSEFGHSPCVEIFIPSLQDTFRLQNSFSLQSLPPYTPLTRPLPNAIIFWLEEDTRKQLAINSLNEALHQIHFICKPPDRDHLQAMDISTLINKPSLTSFAAIRFPFMVHTPPNHSYQMYSSMTEHISLGRLVRDNQKLQAMWAALTRPQTWMDRSRLA